MPQWSKNYIYFGSRLLATEEPNEMAVSSSHIIILIVWGRGW